MLMVSEYFKTSICLSDVMNACILPAQVFCVQYQIPYKQLFFAEPIQALRIVLRNYINRIQAKYSQENKYEYDHHIRIIFPRITNIWSSYEMYKSCSFKRLYIVILMCEFMFTNSIPLFLFTIILTQTLTLHTYTTRMLPIINIPKLLGLIKINK